MDKKAQWAAPMKVRDDPRFPDEPAVPETDSREPGTDLREPDTDPREQQEWFQRIPEHAREEFRERFRSEEDGPEHVREVRRLTTKRYLIEGAVIAGFCALLVAVGLLGFLFVALGGAAMGAIARAAGLYRFGYAALAAVAYPFLFGLTLTAGGAFQLFHAVIFVSLFSMAGAMHELQRFDSSEI
jgi:hypothetical protein